MERATASYAADHLERAALASLDLDPGTGGLPERAAEALAWPGTAPGGAWRTGRRSTTTSGRWRWPVRKTAGASARRRVQAGMGESRYWLGEYPAAIDVLDRAVELGEKTTTTGRSRSRCGSAATSR